MSATRPPLLDGTNGRNDIIGDILGTAAQFERTVQAVRKSILNLNSMSTQVQDKTGLAQVDEILSGMNSPDFYTKNEITGLSGLSFIDKYVDVTSILSIYKMQLKRRANPSDYHEGNFDMDFTDKDMFELQLRCIVDARSIYFYIDSILSPKKHKSLTTFLDTLKTNESSRIRKFAEKVLSYIDNLHNVMETINYDLHTKDVRDCEAWIEAKHHPEKPKPPTLPEKPKAWTPWGRGHARQIKSHRTLRRGFRACLNEDSRSPSPASRTEPDLRDMRRLLCAL